ncbi:MAG TPA: hypothetical protein VD908_06995 [Cytophagales bacterium]|nr:hypothetical protein [Cytophagales bacterium]
MKTGVILLILLFLSGGEVHKTARINKEKSAAEKAFKEGNYKEALTHYKILTDSFEVKEEPVLINKAHCYYRMKDSVQAKKVYGALVNAGDNSIKSIANNQLGLLAFKEKNLDMAQNYFKAALKALPQNGEARYNYELVTMLLNRPENKENKDKNQEDQKQKPFEPSAFAKKLKAQAESLSGSYKYEEAYNLMTEGAKKDKTVLYYKDFIDRLKVIADLSKL